MNDTQRHKCPSCHRPMQAMVVEDDPLRGVVEYEWYCDHCAQEAARRDPGAMFG